MQLELTLEIPGVATSPMGMDPTGALRSTSTCSGVCKQAITPEKPCGGVGSHMSAKAWVNGEGWGGVGVLGGETGGFIGIILESWLDPTFSLGVLVGWGISPAATTGWDGCNTFSHPKNFGAPPSRAGSGTQCSLDISAAQRVCRLSSSSFLVRATPWKTSSSVKERYHFTSSLGSNMLFASSHGPPPAGRLFCSAQCWRALAYATTFSLGISLMPIHAKNQVSWGHKLLSAKAWQCRGSLESGLLWT